MLLVLPQFGGSLMRRAKWFLAATAIDLDGFIPERLHASSKAAALAR
jgi:hypothetical protein